MVQHPKFYYFDAGVYRTLRPKGPLDPAEEIDGAALETLVLQDIRALNAQLGLGYELYYWRTQDQKEVDFILYGERGLLAIEVKRSSRFRDADLAHLKAFLEDYPQAKGLLFYGGDKPYEFGEIRVLPLAAALPGLPALLERPGGPQGT